MAIFPTASSSHNATATQLEMQRQIALRAATTQSACDQAEISYYRAMIASAKANNCSYEPFVRALQTLGTGGV
jgi:hypothetical protein